MSSCSGRPEIKHLSWIFPEVGEVPAFFYLDEEIMKGIQFVIDGQGKKKAVLIDLEQWGEAWEDIYDVLVSRSRKDEPTVAWETNEYCGKDSAACRIETKPAPG